MNTVSLRILIVDYFLYGLIYTEKFALLLVYKKRDIL